MATAKKAAAKKAVKKAVVKKAATKAVVKKAVKKAVVKKAVKKAVVKKAVKKAVVKKAVAKKRTPNAAFMKALTPSPQLAAVVGAAPLPRTEVVSKLWAYIKKNKLQDAVNKRMVNADAKLKEIFGKGQVSMFEMAGLIGKHVK
ncbi:MAG TPA: SWIB/MDM2 domain-containing protein [Ramlibacter sp.]|nr:SWIB/MDM2 domain-containing protein [Ramlibacter sp.]